MPATLPPPPSRAASSFNERPSTSMSSPPSSEAPLVDHVRPRSSIFNRVRQAQRRERPVATYHPSPVEHGGDDTMSCVIVIFTFWLFVSMTLIMGIYGSKELHIGPYSSILLQPSPFFVHKIKVKNSKEMKMDPVLYGFYKAPPLDFTMTWSESLHGTVKPESNLEWVYFLNEGSQLNISYHLPSSLSLLLVIARGIQEMAAWIENPSFRDGTLSWNIIRGNGTIVQDISKSCDYHVAVGNLNYEDVQVKLHTSVRSSMHDTTNSYFMCNLTRGSCDLKIPFPGGNAAVLATPGPQEDGRSDKVHVKLSYQPRWVTYFLGVGGMSSVMFWAFNFLKRLRCNEGDSVDDVVADSVPDRAPLLAYKNDELSSSGSSYDSGSQNDEEFPDHLEDGLCEGRLMGEGGKKYNPKQCVICFDSPKDCFFIPCGHCASCFACGTRIAEDAGICPICRRKIKKVRRIYNV